MNINNSELSAAIEKLEQLKVELQQAELQYDEALTHAANYSGNDDNIEKHRDDLAAAAYDNVQRIKNLISIQIKLIETLRGK
jgi:type II secretory pathway component PulJ